MLTYERLNTLLNFNFVKVAYLITVAFISGYEYVNKIKQLKITLGFEL